MSKKSIPYFSIVIPTRERADTLQHAIRTCVDQGFEDCEFVISDNFSEDDTYEVVKGFRDERIKYYNTGCRIGMSNNWEFALSKAQGKFVCYIGDDDGLTIGALQKAHQILSFSGVEALWNNAAHYYWKNYQDDNLSNQLTFNISDEFNIQPIVNRLNSVIKFQETYTHLPGLYYNFVKNTAIQRAYGKNGQFFHSINPDIYSSIAISAVISEVGIYEGSLTISGISKNSTGQSSHQDPEKSSFKKYLSENSIPFHHSFCISLNHAILTAESFYQARENINELERYTMSIESVIEAAIKISESQPEHVFQQHLMEIKQLAIKNNLVPIFNHYMGKFRRQHMSHLRCISYSFRTGYTCFDGNDFSLKNVHDVAQFINNFKCLNIKNFIRMEYLRLDLPKTIRRFMRFLTRINRFIINFERKYLFK